MGLDQFVFLWLVAMKGEVRWVQNAFHFADGTQGQDTPTVLDNVKVLESGINETL